MELELNIFSVSYDKKHLIFRNLTLVMDRRWPTAVHTAVYTAVYTAVAVYSVVSAVGDIRQTPNSQVSLLFGAAFYHFKQGFFPHKPRIKTFH